MFFITSDVPPPIDCAGAPTTSAAHAADAGSSSRTRVQSRAARRPSLPRRPPATRAPRERASPATGAAASPSEALLHPLPQQRQHALVDEEARELLTRDGVDARRPSCAPSPRGSASSPGCGSTRRHRSRCARSRASCSRPASRRRPLRSRRRRGRTRRTAAPSRSRRRRSCCAAVITSTPGVAMSSPNSVRLDRAALVRLARRRGRGGDRAWSSARPSSTPCRRSRSSHRRRAPPSCAGSRGRSPPTAPRTAGTSSPRRAGSAGSTGGTARRCRA